jgi:hypothetical protein
MLPPSAVGTALFSQVKDVDAIGRDLALARRLQAVQYFVPADQFIRPSLALLDYLTSSLSAESTFVLNDVEPGEPRRMLVAHRVDDATLSVAWLRLAADSEPSSDGNASIDRVPATGDTPARVIVQQVGPGVTWSDGMHTKVLHLALAWLDVHRPAEETTA